MKCTVLYRKGSHITDLSIQHCGRICVMSGGVGGEFCTYIPISSEPILLKALLKTQKSWIKRLIPIKDNKQEIFKLLVEKFSSQDKDPDTAITAFLKAHKIEFTSEYWPSR